MSRARNRFIRKTGKRNYRKIFILAVEGVKTEPQYFQYLKGRYTTVHVECLKGKHESAPSQVLKRMEEHLKNFNFHKKDEAWLVVVSKDVVHT